MPSLTPCLPSGNIFYQSSMLYWARLRGLFKPIHRGLLGKLSRVSPRRMRKQEARAVREYRIAEVRYAGRHDRWTSP